MNGDVSFNKILLQAVDEGLSMLGKHERLAVYHLMRKFELSPEEVPENLTLFSGVLQQFSGFGSEVIEALIARRLYSRLGLCFEIHDKWDLAKYVANAKCHIEDKRH